MQQRTRSFLTMAATTAVVASLSTLECTNAFLQPQRSASSLKPRGREELAFPLQRHYYRAALLHMSSSDDDSGWQAPKSAMIGGAGVNNAGEPPFEIRGFSLGNFVVAAGVLVTIASFVDYLSESSDSLSVSGLGFVYGIPIFLAGAALKYAEIEPAPVRTTPQADAVFESKATETIRKIKQDVTRHRYGDEAHLDTTVKKLGLVVPGKDYPQLQELRQEVTDNGELAFTMVWQSIDTPYKMWADERRVKKYETFFGPNVSADVIKIDAEQRLVGIRLTTGGPKKATSAPVATTSEPAAAAEPADATTPAEATPAETSA